MEFAVGSSELDPRVRMLFEVLEAFAEAATDYASLLDVVARGLAEVVKDACIVRLLAPDGWLNVVASHVPFERAGVSAADADKVRTFLSSPHHISAHAAAARVVETGEALFVPTIDMRQIRAQTTEEIAALYEPIGVHSLLLVPLRARGKSIGLISLFRFAPGSAPLDETDRQLAKTLANHAALALLNAQLYDTAQRELADRKRAQDALRKTEQQLRHVQKMEAVGRLAGGVAHDFNNLLSVILSYTELLLDGLNQGDPLRDELLEIQKAGERASDLTRQLLAFSRQQVLQPRVLDLGRAVTGMERMLRRLLGADIELTVLGPAELGAVLVDPGQIEQVIMNLAVNARDAMPEGGKLTLELQNVTLDEAYAAEHPEVVPGRYVMLAVSDTGAGIEQAIQSRIFEPFFTTKSVGKGVGLGLSTVFGIVKQSGGHIWLYSEPGAGTTFKVYLPRVDAALEEELAPQPPPTKALPNETILLVEDDPQVRAVVCGILRRNGYVVLEASNAGEALLACEQHPATIHLLLTDVIMPKLSGPQLAKRLATQRPDMKVLFMSGYTDDAIMHHGMLESQAAFLQKPITPDRLSRKLREVLDAAPP